jgi:uncharacterized repeat protein (TIGR01451 family)
VNNCARVQFEHGQCVCTRLSRPGITLRKTGPKAAVLSETLTYQLTVTNTGTTDVAGVKVTDTLPAGLEPVGGKNPLTWDLGTVPAGQSRSVEYQVTARKTGRLCNRARATGAGGVRAEAQSCVVVGEAAMTLAKTGPRERYANTPATYLITVKNTGKLPLDNVVITDPVPPQTSFVRASNGGQLNGDSVQWSLGTLDPGTSRTVQVTLRARAAGVVRNRATAAADRGLTAAAEAVTNFKGVSALLVEVTDTEDPVEVGAETGYVITVRNQGTVPATNIKVEALIPRELTLLSAKGPVDNKLGKATREGQTLLYEPLRRLAPGAAVTFEVRVRAEKPGDVRFKVDVTADQLKAGGPVHEEESTYIYADVGPLRSQAVRRALFFWTRQRR